MITPITANRKKVPIPNAASSDGTYSARSPLMNQPKNTAIPIARPRICSGKISASHTQTATLRKVCIDSTNAVIRDEDHVRAGRAALREDAARRCRRGRWQVVVRNRPMKNVLRRSIRSML